MRGLSLVAASGGHSSLRCAGLSLSRPLLLQSTSSRRAGSVVVAHGLSCSAACGIFPDQGSNPCPRHALAVVQRVEYFYVATVSTSGSTAAAGRAEMELSVMSQGLGTTECWGQRGLD